MFRILKTISLLGRGYITIQCGGKMTLYPPPYLYVFISGGKPGSGADIQWHSKLVDSWQFLQTVVCFSSGSVLVPQEFSTPSVLVGAENGVRCVCGVTVVLKQQRQHWRNMLLQQRFLKVIRFGLL